MWQPQQVVAAAVAGSATSPRLLLEPAAARFAHVRRGDVREWNFTADDGRVVGVRPHYAEYWRGGRIVPGTPSPRLSACMDGALRGLVLPPPVRAGWIRVRFET